MEEKFLVTGMTCAACQAHVSRAVNGLACVRQAQVNLLSGMMQVQYLDEQSHAPEVLEAVIKAGYGAEPAGAGETVWNGALRQRRSLAAEAEQEHLRKRWQRTLIILLPLFYLSAGSMWGWPLPGFLFGPEHILRLAAVECLLASAALAVNWELFVSGLRSLIARAPNMDALVCLGSGASFLYSLWGLMTLALKVWQLGQLSQSGSAQDTALILTVAAQAFSNSAYFDSAAFILFFVSIGKYLEAKSKARTSKALEKLADLAPQTATVIRNDQEQEIAVSQLVVGDIVLVRPGQTVPVDGVVIQGASSVNQAALTGESLPVLKKVGDEVMSASINCEGSFRFRASQVGADTTLAQIIRLVDEAANSKASGTRLADRVSSIFVPTVIFTALVTATIWLLGGAGTGRAVAFGVSVLVISCPCALGLAVPLAVMAGMGRAAQMGILIRNAQSLENLHSLKAVILDKTGTVTLGQPTVIDIKAAPMQAEAADLKSETGSAMVERAADARLKAGAGHGTVASPEGGAERVAEAVHGTGADLAAGAGQEAGVDSVAGAGQKPGAEQEAVASPDVVVTSKAAFGSEELLAQVAALEAQSRHPLAQAVVKAAQERHLKLPLAEDFQELVGLGTKGKIGGRVWLVGSAKFIELERCVNIQEWRQARDVIEEWEKRGRTVLYAAVDIPNSVGSSDAGGNLVYEPVDCPGGADDLMGASSSARASDIVGAGVSAAEVKLRKSSKFWAGALALADVLRPSSREAIGELHKLGLKTALLTGDRQAAAMSIAQEAGVNVLMAEVLPVQKEAFVRQTQAEVGAVAMVGDGINDAPALKRADVGISIRVGSDIAVESADVVLMKNDITAVASAIRLSRAVVANIKENLFWAFFYNCLGIPIAAGLFYPLWGWHLTPALASLAMSCSSLFVVGNALRLTRFQDKAQKVSLDSNLTVEGQALGALRIAHLKPEFLADIRTEGENDQNTRGAELFSEAERIDMQKTIKINGMMCAHCEAHVRKALEALEGVEKAEVSHEKGEAVVTLGSNVDDAVLKAAVVEAGYEVLQVL